MASKNHSLDEKIIEAAYREFLEHGYRKASLHQIAERAGLTTGALYTRYRDKDDLFCSLVEETLQKITGQSSFIRDEYTKAHRCGGANELIRAIQIEEKIYLDILFQYYDECLLFFCRSDGSSVEARLCQMMEKKAESTVSYLQSIAQKPVDFDGVKLIIYEQFHFYRTILEKGYTKEKAFSCMKTVDLFLEAGWKALFEQMM